MIVFETSGFLTTIQDDGRYGYQKFGVSPAGPMDRRSFHLANILAGNHREEGALEITYMGPKIHFEESNIISITGGDLGATINGKEIPMYQAILVQKGDTLQFSGVKNGCRSYIAFSGGLALPEIMGSKATLIRNQLGPIDGRAIKAGDHIAFSSPKTTLPHFNQRFAPQELFGKSEICLRVLLGPQDDCFTSKAFHTFFQSSYTISNEFDRMGCRLEGKKIEHKVDGNIITDGIAFGSVQVPTNGQPIIMLADRQSTGGYTKIATVISPDLSLLAQSMPGNQVRFLKVSLSTAEIIYLRYQKELADLEKKLNQ